MGAWGSGPFDNDDAADWLEELEERSDIAFLRSSLTPGWFDYIYLQAPKGSVIIAAAEVLAAGLGRASPDLPLDAKRWAQSHARREYQALVRQAQIGLHRVMGGRSELRSLWADNSTDAADWESRMRELIDRVSAQL